MTSDLGPAADYLLNSSRVTIENGLNFSGELRNASTPFLVAALMILETEAAKTTKLRDQLYELLQRRCLTPGELADVKAALKKEIQ